MRVCSDRNGHIVLATRRTNKRTTAIVLERKVRKFRVIFNREFDAVYRIIAVNPEQVAAVWLRSQLKMTEQVKKELEMIIAVKANKVIAKYEDGAAPVEEKGVKLFDSHEALASLRLPGLTKVYNNCVVENEQIKGFEDIAVGCSETWDAMVEYEIPVKAEKVKKEKAPKAEGTGKKSVLPEFTTITVINPDHKKRGVRKEIFDKICACTTIEELKAQTFEQNGVVKKIASADILAAIELGIIAVS